MVIKHGITSYNYNIIVIIITGLTMERLEDAPLNDREYDNEK